MTHGRGGRTFDQWKAAGYYINKGERSSSRNNNREPLFTVDQVQASVCIGQRNRRRCDYDQDPDPYLDYGEWQ